MRAALLTPGVLRAGQSLFLHVLVEARDRIRGETWTAQRDGGKYEMGGTSIHWQQGFVWREMVRYGLDRRLKITPNEDYPDYAVNCTVLDGKVWEEPLGRSFGSTDLLPRRILASGALTALLMLAPST